MVQRPPALGHHPQTAALRPVPMLQGNPWVCCASGLQASPATGTGLARILLAWIESWAGKPAPGTHDRDRLKRSLQERKAHRLEAGFRVGYLVWFATSCSDNQVPMQAPGYCSAAAQCPPDSCDSTGRPGVEKSPPDPRAFLKTKGVLPGTSPTFSNLLQPSPTFSGVLWPLSPCSSPLRFMNPLATLCSPNLQRIARSPMLF